MTGAHWTALQAQELGAALAARGDAGVGYCELAGFLFAVACAPEPVMPSEWIPEVLPRGERDFDSFEEAQRVMDLIMALHNRINREVLERKPALPAGIEVRANAMENFGPQVPLGQWAAGFGAGQLWLEETWTRCLGVEADAGSLDEALGGLNAALSFFTSRELAERWLPKMPGNPTLEEAARRTLEALPTAMRALADIGRGLDEERRARARTPVRRAKVGRNDPCPCGSGRKFKKCHGSQS